MPNQLSPSKRRASLAEHEAVLAALATIALRERTTVMDLLREGARQVVRSRSIDPAKASAVRKSIWACAPKMPARFKSPAHVARFKRAQREFDILVQELNLAAPAAVQERNSLVPAARAVRVLAFVDASSV
jgi:7-keto-8-aminopelargonate synthetase-like enzyme